MDHSIKSYLIRGITIVSLAALMTGCGSHSSSSMQDNQPPTYESACSSNPYLMKYNCSIKRIQNAAENGNADAQYALGYMYYYGIGTTKDQQTGELWIQRAAAAGQPLAKRAWSLINTGATFNDFHKAASAQQAQESRTASTIVQQEPVNVTDLNSTVHKEPITTYLPGYNSVHPNNEPNPGTAALLQPQNVNASPPPAAVAAQNASGEQ